MIRKECGYFLESFLLLGSGQLSPRASIRCLGSADIFFAPLQRNRFETFQIASHSIDDVSVRPHECAVCSLAHMVPVFLNIPLMRVLDKPRPSLTSMTQTSDHACAATEDTTSNN